MPGPLRDVEQRVTMDASGYHREAVAIVTDNIAIRDSIDKEVLAGIREIGTALKSLPDSRRISIELAGADEAIRQVTELKGALDSLGDRKVSISGDNGLMLRELRDISASMDMVTTSMGYMEEHLAAIRRNAGDSATALAAQTQALRDNADAHNAAASAAAAHAAAQRSGTGGDFAAVPGGRGGRGGLFASDAL